MPGVEKCSPWRPPEGSGCSLGLGSKHELSPLDLELDLGGGPGHGQLARGGGGPVYSTVQHSTVQYSTVQYLDSWPEVVGVRTEGEPLL